MILTKIAFIKLRREEMLEGNHFNYILPIRFDDVQRILGGFSLINMFENILC